MNVCLILLRINCQVTMTTNRDRYVFWMFVPRNCIFFIDEIAMAGNLTVRKNSLIHVHGSNHCWNFLSLSLYRQCILSLFQEAIPITLDNLLVDSGPHHPPFPMWHLVILHSFSPVWHDIFLFHKKHSFSRLFVVSFMHLFGCHWIFKKLWQLPSPMCYLVTLSWPFKGQGCREYLNDPLP